MEKLPGKQARYLRTLGHKLRPVVLVGKDGISGNLVASADKALTAHELIKVKPLDGYPPDLRGAAELLTNRAGATIAQVLGKTILLYREGEEKRIELPEA